jgi:hypothetical protein
MLDIHDALIIPAIVAVFGDKSEVVTRADVPSRLR